MKARLEGFNLVIKTHIEHGCRHPTPVIYSIHRAEPGAAVCVALRSCVTSLLAYNFPGVFRWWAHERLHKQPRHPNTTRPYQYLASFSSVRSMDRLVRRWLVYSNRPDSTPHTPPRLLFFFCLIIILFFFLLYKQWRGLRNSIGIHCLSGRAEQYGSVPNVYRKLTKRKT